MAALAPGTVETDVLDVVAAAVDGKAVELGLLMRRIEAQGVQAVTLCIQTLRYMRALHVATSDPGGVAAGIARSFGFGDAARCHAGAGTEMGRAGAWNRRWRCWSKPT